MPVFYHDPVGFGRAVDAAIGLLPSNRSPGEQLEDLRMEIDALANFPFDLGKRPRRVRGLIPSLLVRLRALLLSPHYEHAEYLASVLQRMHGVLTDLATPPSDKPGFLIVVPYNMARTIAGGSARTKALARVLAGRYRVDILCVASGNRPPEVIPLADGIRLYCAPVTESFRRKESELKARCAEAAQPIALHDHWGEVPALANWFGDLAAKADMIMLYAPYLMPLCAAVAPGKPVVYESPELNRHFLVRYAKDAGADVDYVSKRQAEMEEEICRAAACIMMASDEDAGDLVAAHPSAKGKIVIVPNGVDVKGTDFVPPSRSLFCRSCAGLDRRVVAFVGAMTYKPNLKAVEFIMNTLCPALPETLFVLVGPKSDQYIDKAALPPNAVITYEVPARIKNGILSLCDAAIAPLGHDSGSSLKIPDYLAHGKPVLCTDHGIRGFNGIDRFVNVASMEDFSSRLGALLRDVESDRQRFDAAAREARSWLLDHLDWAAAARPFTGWLDRSGGS